MMDAVIQTIMGMLASACFAILFGIHDYKLGYIMLGSGLGWAVYLICRDQGGSLFLGLFLCSLVIAIYSEVFARILRAPVILILVPALIPEIPGKDLYYTMYYLVRQDYVSFGIASNTVLLEAGAIALGILLISHGSGVIRSIMSRQTGHSH